MQIKSHKDLQFNSFAQKEISVLLKNSKFRQIMDVIYNKVMMIL